jgi:hypothetical protein
LLEGESVYHGKTSINDGQVFAKPGTCYALYFPTAQETGTLDLMAAPGRFTKQWYDPRSGQFAGSRETVTGGVKVQPGPPPADPEKDWAMLLKQEQ